MSESLSDQKGVVEDLDIDNFGEGNMTWNLYGRTNRLSQIRLVPVGSIIIQLPIL